MAEDPGWPDADLALLESIYELKCNSKMNALYYERRLGQLQTHSFWMEIALAATASGTGLAALTVFETDAGRWAWQGLALLAALVSVVRPIYAPGKKIEAFARQQQGYHANFFNLKKLAFSIRQEGCVTADHRRRYDTFFDRHVQLSTEDESAPKRKMLEDAQRRTEVALPSAQFWWPAGAAPRKLQVAGDEAAPPPPEAGSAETAPAAGTEAPAAPQSVFFEKVTGRTEDQIIAATAAGKVELGVVSSPVGGADPGQGGGAAKGDR